MEQRQTHDRESRGIEDITARLDQMNVDMEVEQQYQIQQHLSRDVGHDASFYYHDQSAEIMMYEDSVRAENFATSIQNQQQQQQNAILICTNVDSSVFVDKSMQARFEALFLAFDPNITFRYLKSFRRVRLDFSNFESAELARSNLNTYQLGNTQFKCYSAHIIKPTNNNQDPLAHSSHLNIPKLTKQFLISPPASPPVGWEPVSESSPCIDVQLISAIANLVPGKVHEIHAGNESQPGIYVEVCEDAHSDPASMHACSRIPRTMSPGYCQQTF